MEGRERKRERIGHIRIMFGSRKLFSIVPRLLRGNQLRSGMATMPEPLKMKKTTKRYVRERLFFFPRDERKDGDHTFNTKKPFHLSGPEE